MLLEDLTADEWVELAREEGREKGRERGITGLFALFTEPELYYRIFLD